MKNIRIFLISLASLTFLAGFSGIGYLLYNKFNRKAESPFNAIPGNTAMIIQLNQAGQLLSELNRTNLLWRSVSRFPGILTVRTELKYIDSASRTNEHIDRIFRQSSIWVAITLSGKSNFGALYLATIGSHDADGDILDFINKFSGNGALITSTPYSTTQLHRVQMKGGRAPFYFAVMKGVFTGSYHANLVKRSLDRLSLNTPMATSAGFSEVVSTTGKKTDANIYVNYRFFSLLLSSVTRDETLPELIKLSNFADWSGMDLIIKKDELLFNGITVASDSSHHFLSLFSDQEPVNLQITQVIPASATWFTSFAWSDPLRFTIRLQTQNLNSESNTPVQSSFLAFMDKYQLNINEYIIPWMSGEMCLFGMESRIANEAMKIIAIGASDSLKALKSLRSLSDSIGRVTDSIRYKKHTIFLTEFPQLLPAMFGETFGRITPGCYTLFNNHLFLAEKPDALQDVIDHVKNGNTLFADREFTDFKGNLPDQYNIISYYNTSSSIPFVRQVINQGLLQQFNPMVDSLRKIESVAFQFSNTDGKFYSNVFLRYNPKPSDEGPLLWLAQLDTTIVGSPKIISLDRNKNKAIVVSDVNHNLYMVSGDGNIQWKINLNGNILGSVHPIMLPGKDSASLLLNTPTHLYLLNANGSHADNFPMRFPLNATNGLTVIPPKDGDDYRILIAFQDNRIYQFDLEGQSVREWQRPFAGETVTHPVSFLSHGKKNFVAVVGHQGKTLITSSQGTPSVNIKPGFANTPYSEIYINTTNRKGTFLTTNAAGKVVFIQEKGQISEVTLNLFTPGHRFFFADITGNGQPEFIFSDRNQIFYYDRNYKLIYSYPFRREIFNDPFILKSPDGKVLIGFVVPETKELFLFDRHGYHELESGIRGDTPFDIGYLASEYPLSLIVGSGKVLKNFRLTKL